MWTLCLVFLYFIDTAEPIPDQCIFHNTVPGEFDRSSTNDVKVDRQHAHCDTFEDGWYRFRSNEIATSCVPYQHCGTISTVWMKDSVPDIDQTRERSFCVNHGDPGNCCLYSFMVNVTNCDGLLVYNFLKGDLLCPSAFCTGSLKRCKNNQASTTGFEPCSGSDHKIPCPPGKTSATGFEPCTDIKVPCKNGQTSPTGFEPCSDPLPVMSRPVLHAPSLLPGHQDFVQHCDVGYTGSDPHVAFWVTWLFDGVKHKSLELTGGINTTRISSFDWKGHIGKKLTCMVEAQILQGNSRLKTDPLTSNEYHGAVTMFQSQVVGQNDQVAVTLTSTLPPVCSRVPSSVCKVDMELMIRGRGADTINGVDGCFARFWAKDWDPKSNTVTATANINFKPGTASVYEITFKELGDSLGHEMWKQYVMTPMQLHIDNVNSQIRGRSANRNTYIDETSPSNMNDEPSVWICKCQGQNTQCQSQVKVPLANTITPPLVG